MIGWKIEPSGNFKINDVSILTSTTLGTSVVSSYLKTVGNLSELTVGTNKLKVTTSGIVGIGTASPNPSYRLNVETSGVNPTAINLYGPLRRKSVILTPSPKDFGAVGDGITDDTAAFQAAIDATVTTDIKEIELKENEVYRVNSLTISSDIEIRGPETAKILWLAGSQTTSMITISGSPTIKFYGLTFDGDCYNPVFTDPVGEYASVEATMSNGGVVEFDSVYFINGRRMDIKVTGPSTSGETCRLAIRNCKFLNGLLSSSSSSKPCQSVASRDGVDIVATDNLFSGSAPNNTSTFGRGGIQHKRQTSTGTCWGTFYAFGNIFRNMGLRGTVSQTIGCLYNYSGARSVRFIGNRADTPFGTVFGAKADATEIVMFGNTVNNQTSTANDFAIGIFDQTDSYTTSGGSGMVVSNNVVNTSSGNAYSLLGDRPGVLTDFTGAVFSNNIAISAARALYIVNCQNAVFTNFISQDCTTGVITSGTLSGQITFSDWILSGGTEGFRFSSTMTNADIKIRRNNANGITSFVDFDNSSRSFMLTGNDIYNCTNGFITVGSTQSGIIRQNRLRSVTSPWTKSGSYGNLIWEKNESSTDLAFGVRNVTISGGVIQVFADYHPVTGEGSTADDLVTINGGTPGQIITLLPATTGQNITVSSGGNIVLTTTGNFVMNGGRDTITLLRRQSDWVEIARSDNQ